MYCFLRHVPGVSPNSQQTDFPVLLPYQGYFKGEVFDLRFSRWLASSSPWILFVIFLLISFYPLAVIAQSKYTLSQAFSTLWRWLPFVVGSGFVMNLLISFFTMLFGTVAGVLLGLGQISIISPIRKISWFLTQLFRNSPWLVLLFIVMLTFPFEIEIGKMNRQCLNRRIAKWEELEQELTARENRRNDERASIKWMFDVQQARQKLNRAYAKLTCQN